MKKIATIFICLLVLVLGGFGGLNYILAKKESDLHVPSVEEVLQNGYPTNNSGLTYGPYLIGYISDEPDLTLVKNEDGVQGYVYTKEFNIDGDVATEEEAICKAKDGRKIIIIPMYLQDGKTVIGEFKIGS